MTLSIVIIGSISLFLIIFYLFIYVLHKKIEKLEYKIDSQFNKRNDLIPAIFEISKNFLVKHPDIFKEIIYLRKHSFTENSFHKELGYKLITQEKIHKELNFIFRVCNKHDELIKEGRFIYLRELIIERSFFLGKNIEIYKQIVQKYNRLIFLKNLSIIGLLIPLDYRFIK